MDWEKFRRHDAQRMGHLECVPAELTYTCATENLDPCSHVVGPHLQKTRGHLSSGGILMCYLVCEGYRVGRAVPERPSGPQHFEGSLITVEGEGGGLVSVTLG